MSSILNNLTNAGAYFIQGSKCVSLIDVMSEYFVMPSIYTYIDRCLAYKTAALTNQLLSHTIVRQT
jgi:hypothetical protein